MSPRRGRTGTVLRVRFVVLAVARVRRASWEITRPAVDFSFVASSLAAWRTSSSISIVVRMHLMLSHRLVMSNPVHAFVFLLCQFFCYRTAVLLETKNSSGADTISLEEIRRCFPALARTHNGFSVAYFDGPGGTQVPRAVVEAMNDYLYHHNANTHWAYPTSEETDAIIDSARSTLADFLNASPTEIVIGAASNALGTINDVKRARDMAHSSGAKIFVDAVHYAPHGLIDVRDWNCDFLVCSAYKFYGPHIGVLYGRHDLLGSLDFPKLI